MSKKGTDAWGRPHSDRAKGQKKNGFFGTKDAKAKKRAKAKKANASKRGGFWS